MNLPNKTKQGQALALNTIVIAILVIIVLLVIIVFFTSQVGDTGDQLEQNSASQCSISNPALATLYDENDIFTPINQGDTTDETCPDGSKKVMGVSNCCVQQVE